MAAANHSNADGASQPVAGDHAALDTQDVDVEALYAAPDDVPEALPERSWERYAAPEDRLAWLYNHDTTEWFWESDPHPWEYHVSFLGTRWWHHAEANRWFVQPKWLPHEASIASEAQGRGVLHHHLPTWR